METLIRTETSFLNIVNLHDNKLLVKMCVREIDPLLHYHPPIVVYGKTRRQNRSVGFFSNVSKGYIYSGQIMTSQSLSANLETLLMRTNELFGSAFNGVLVNKYDDGKDYISAHSDDEKELDQVGVVAISHGAVRKFRIRRRDTKKIYLDIPTTSGTYIHMGGNFQSEFTHEIPKQLRIKGVRYSFTFRKHTI